MKDNAKRGFGAMFDAVTGRIRRFISDTVAEMKRCTWPTRQQLLESTGLVVVAIIILALFVFGVDEVARAVITWVTVGR
jgi:preprotein translocase subunit SecE